jgi:hypothetical protein
VQRFLAWRFSPEGRPFRHSRVRPGVEALDGRDLLTGGIYPEPEQHEPPSNRGPVYFNDGTLHVEGLNATTVSRSPAQGIDWQ